MSFQVGDLVKTHTDEKGTIVAPFNDGFDPEDRGYNWWVEIEFTFQGKKRTTREPYRNNELRKNSES